MIMGKKKYISPVSGLVEMGTLYMLALSQDKKEENQLESDEQLSKEYRGDWSNIWEGM